MMYSFIAVMGKKIYMYVHTISCLCITKLDIVKLRHIVIFENTLFVQKPVLCTLGVAFFII